MASFFNEMSEVIALHFVTTIRYRTITGPMDNQILVLSVGTGAQYTSSRSNKLLRSQCIICSNYF